MKKYEMIRRGTFATSAETKILFTSIALGMTYDNPGYFSLFSISSIGWAFIEGLIQLMKIRKICSMTFMGRPVPIPIGWILQGTTEAGFVVIYGIYFGDRLYTHFNLMLTSSGAICAYVISRRKSFRISSKRHINNMSSCVFIGLVVLVDAYCLTYIETIRPLCMLVCMVFLGCMWTFAQIVVGARGVLVDNKPTSSAEMCTVLSLDVLVEVGLAYLPFYFFYIACFSP
jgi:hypothetical protein